MIHDKQDGPEPDGLHAGLQDAFGRLYALMAALRTPQTGCPWDLEQSFASIAPYTLEEAYEVVEAIETDDMPALCDELGDLLLQVVFHARMAEESNHFTLKDVVEGLNIKMIRRHPHVFGDQANEAHNARSQIESWEAIKALERQEKRARQQKPPEDLPKSALEGITRTLPALQRAQKLQNRAARVGFDWRDVGGVPNVEGVLDKIEEELAEVKAALSSGSKAALQDEIGDLLFSVVNLARKTDIDADAALRQANLKFETRFKAMEQRAHALQGTNSTAGPPDIKAQSPLAHYSPEALEALWQAVKQDSKA
jgi:MazG family protein